MKLRLTALLMLLSCFAAKPAASQALATATGPGSSVVLGGGVSGFNTDYGHHRIAGAVLFADVHPHWRLGLEGEARLLRWHTEEQVTESTYLGGLHVLLTPHPSAWQPYAKFLAGTGHITLPYGYAHGSFLTYAGGVGLDFSLSDRVALRAIDVEYQHWPQFSYGALSPYGVSTGISLRLNPMRRYPEGRYRRQH